MENAVDELKDWLKYSQMRREKLIKEKFNGKYPEFPKIEDRYWDLMDCSSVCSFIDHFLRGTKPPWDYLEVKNEGLEM